MATPARTQKQIAERYKGNLTYYKLRHPWRVARFCASFVAIVGGLGAILFYQGLIFQKRASEQFFSAGRISSHHAQFEQDCSRCHDKNAAIGNDLTPAKFTGVLKDRFKRGLDFASIDNRCERCHEDEHPPVGMKKEYDVHEPNVVDKRACSICHMEHLGPGPMKRVADSQCATCHNDPGVMEASARKGTTLPAAVFEVRRPAQGHLPAVSRPAQGYTQVFASFHRGHPEFQLIRDKTPDPDTLKFNHSRHFANDIPPVKGQKLDCNYCHKPDPQGRFYLRINFEAHCQSCHALQFDERNPSLHLPHGDVNLVRTFLRTLPAQYAELARSQPNKTVPSSDVKTFIAQQMNGLRRQFGSDEAFERAVFFETSPYKREDAAPSKANFSGCAHCHDVKTEGRIPVITPPVLIDRWILRANFTHAKHTSVSCESCHHQARTSQLTADVLMPSKQNCIVCHSPETKKVSSDCITCHTYHEPGQPVRLEVQADVRR
jgi:Cytochrome c7 and related cytochrome c